MAEGLVFTTYNGPLQVNEERRAFKCLMTTSTMDRDREYIEPEAFLEDLHFYQENPVLLLGHNHRTTPDTLPIGKCLEIKVVSNGLEAEFYLAPTRVGDECLTLLKTGCIRAVSAGFVPIDVIRNPTDAQLPHYLRGKGIKSWYRRVELVEVSLLSIPSNREALVLAAEKGNRVADMVVKSWDGEDVAYIFKEWLTEEKSIESVVPEITWKGFVGKIFDLWKEEDHPRDESGMFAEKPNFSHVPLSSVNRPATWSVFHSDPKNEELNKKLDTLILSQGKMQKDIEQIKDKDGWGAWAKKWTIRIGVVAGLYYGVKRMANNPEVREKVKNWVLGQMTKGVKELDAIDKLLGILDVTKLALQKAELIGATGTPEYKRLKLFYNRMTATLVETVRENVGQLTNILKTKEMTVEEFKEEEHPRGEDGKFRDKNSTSKINTTGKVAVAAGVFMATDAAIYFGIKIAKGSNVLVAASKNTKATVEEIIAAGGKGKTEAIESILNIRIVEDDIKHDSLAGFAKEVYDYIKNPSGLQRDLAETFGHLNVGGSKHIIIRDSIDYTATLEGFLKNATMYNPFDGSINVNLREMAMASQAFKISPRRLIEHEYSHSLTMTGERANKLLDRYVGEWAKQLKSLEGQKYTLDLGVPVSGTIEKVKISKRTTEGTWKITIESLKAMGFSVDESALDWARLRQTRSYGATLTIREGNQVHEIPSELFTGIFGQAIGNGIDPARAFIIRGKNFDWRDIYGLSNLTEYIAVKIEKGERLWG